MRPVGFASRSGRESTRSQTRAGSPWWGGGQFELSVAFQRLPESKSWGQFLTFALIWRKVLLRLYRFESRHGVQNKVLEAMAMGKAVVASPQALAGLKLIPACMYSLLPTRANGSRRSNSFLTTRHCESGSARRDANSLKSIIAGIVAWSLSNRFWVFACQHFTEQGVSLTAEILHDGCSPPSASVAEDVGETTGRSSWLSIVQVGVCST